MLLGCGYLARGSRCSAVLLRGNAARGRAGGRPLDRASPRDPLPARLERRRRRSAGPRWLVPVVAGGRRPRARAPRLRGFAPAARSAARARARRAGGAATSRTRRSARRTTTTSASTTSASSTTPSTTPAIPGLANLQTPVRRRRRPPALRRVPRPRPLGAAPGRTSSTACSPRCSPSSSPRASRSAPLRAASRRSRTAWRCCSCPALVIVVVWRPDQRIASPNLDFAAFVLVVVGAALPRRGGRARLPADARSLTAAAALAAASATRPLYWLATLLRDRGSPRSRRPRGAASAPRARPRRAPAGGDGARVDRRGRRSSPATRSSRRRRSGSASTGGCRSTVVTTRTTGITRGRAGPGNQPSFVLGSWHWLQRVLAAAHVPRTPTWRCRSCCSRACRPALLLGAATRPRRQHTMPMLAVVVPCLVDPRRLVPIAPDPRFAWAPIWLVPLALPPGRSPTLRAPPLAVARSSRPGSRRCWSSSWRSSGGVSGWLVPAAVGATLVARRRRRPLPPAAVRGPIALGVTVTALVAGIVVVADVRGAPPAPRHERRPARHAAGPDAVTRRRHHRRRARRPPAGSRRRPVLAGRACASRS